ERTRVPVDTGFGRTRSRRRNVYAVLLVDEDRACGRDAHVDLAVTNVPRVERREPHDELPVGRARGLVADVGREDAPVGEKAASEVLGVVAARLIRRRQLADLLRRQLADLLAAQLEDPPTLRRVGLAGVLAGNEAV